MMKQTSNIIPTDAYSSPPQSKYFELFFDFAPISFQNSNSATKNLFINNVKKILSTFQYYILEDVQIDISWFTDECYRYETDKCPDVDNIIKPILDSFIGPNGFLIDDCQIQSVSSTWIDHSGNQSFEARVKYHWDMTCLKDDLFFIQIDKGLCFPFRKSFSAKIAKTRLESIINSIQAREQMVANGHRMVEALESLPLQRFFHRSRIRDIQIIRHEDFINAKYTA